MTPGTPKKKKGTALAPLLAKAIKARGLSLPETDEEIAAAEMELDRQQDPLPARLNAPLEFLDRTKRFKVEAPKLSAVESTEVERDLEAMGRAAREGGKLSPEVEERMRRDREAAEAEIKTDEED